MLKPLAPKAWNFKTAAHLVNRAGFGGPPVEIEKIQAMGLDAAVSYLVDFERIPDNTPDPAWAKPDPSRAETFLVMRRAGEEERRQKQREIQRAEREHIIELRGWWLRRMAEGPRPLQERMVLFWHGHFATS